MIVMEMKIGNSILKIDDDTKTDCEKEQKQVLDAVVKLIAQNYIYNKEEEKGIIRCNRIRYEG